MTRTTGVPGRRLDVLQALRAAAEPLGIAQLAERLDVHPNTVRFHLDALLEAGEVERAPARRRGPGRPALRFTPVRGMHRGGPRHYRMLAEILVHGLADEPDPGARAAAAGRAWGRQLPAPPDQEEPVEGLVELLDGLGFAPDRDAHGPRRRIDLRQCPFLELARSRAAVICPIHLGLMQGALDAWQAPVTVDRLEPFAEPDRCLVHVGPAGAGR